MKIGKPIKETDMPGARRGKYEDIYAIAAKLSDGEVLPVAFEDRARALRFVNSSRSGLAKRNLVARLRGSVVYISRE